MKKSLIMILIILAVLGVGLYFLLSPEVPKLITTFAECVAAGNPVMESYPRQCRADGETFVEEIGNELEKNNMIRLTSPRPGQTVSSPLIITGEARGNWFFEASFPVMITNWDGLIIGEGIATAEGEWMTTEFVPFKAVLNFNSTSTATEYSKRGTLILKKDNPSGLPENDDALEIPVVIK
ncbi:MAG: Gmad2 immunoglobulin-like domain-containing protein [bacterium]|nr:Gmad2 immunoglobulin-like domain-containing protein [bacterium]